MVGVSRFRGSVFRQRGSVGCVLRTIPFEVHAVEDLNLPKVINDIAGAQRGLILVTGATGMGKSTTVAAMLMQINENRQAHIVTIEEPIEFLFENQRSMIIQREVGTDTNSFQEAMVAALRQEIRALAAVLPGPLPQQWIQRLNPDGTVAQDFKAHSGRP